MSALRLAGSRSGGGEKMILIMDKQTSWDNVAEWYDGLLQGGGDTYQKKVILPNILRSLNIQKGEKILDLACGQGFFSREFAREGAEVTGVDSSKKLIELAKKNSPKNIVFEAWPAESLHVLKNGS